MGTTDVLRIRPARIGDAARIARLQVDSYRSAYAGILPQDHLDRFSYADQEADWIALLTGTTTDVVLVAESGDGQLSGYAVGRSPASFAAPYDSELVSLHVDRTLHRQGIGRRLVAATAEALGARGSQAMMLWVLEANPASAFYERLGAIPLDGQKLTLNACEVAYGWPDTREIASPVPGVNA